jgi:hypothetical protein
MFSRMLCVSFVTAGLVSAALLGGCGGSGSSGGQNAANSAATAAGQAMNGPSQAMTSAAGQKPIPAGLTCKTPIVWVNLSTRVYHEQGDPWYGRTKNGEYMCLATANLKGYHLASTGGAMSNSSGSMGSSMSSSSHHHHQPAPSASST